MPKAKPTTLEHFEDRPSIPEAFGLTVEAFDAILNELEIYFFAHSWREEDSRSKSQAIMDFLAEHADSFSRPLETPNDFFLFGIMVEQALETVRSIQRGLGVQRPSGEVCPDCGEIHG